MTAMVGVARRIQRAQRREEVGRRLDQVAGLGLRLITRPRAVSRHAGPKASSASPGRRCVAFRRTRRARRVVAGELPGALGALAASRPRARATPSTASMRLGAARRRAAAAPAARRAASTHRRLEADAVGAAVEDQRRRAAEVGQHVLGGGRADAAGAVGRWRGDRPRRRRRAAPAPPDAPARAARRCRARRSRARDTRHPAPRGSTSVSGPGQKAAASAAAQRRRARQRRRAPRPRRRARSAG